MKRRRLRSPTWLPLAHRIARFLLKSQLLTVFLGLCALGIWVGAQTRPDSKALPWAELFDQMQVVSFRETPSDTSSRFIVELCACNKTFGRYDVDDRRFLPPERSRVYSRSITGTRYGPLKVRGHVDRGFWLEVPNGSGRSLLPEQFDELYRSTLDYVKPFATASGVLGILSGYSVGYRIGTWGSSLCSRSVQQRVLETPQIGRTIAREAWRRVLLEPAVMGDENAPDRFAAVQGTHRLYASFFRLALNDSDAFIPREADRLSKLGRVVEAETMRGFVRAVERAARDSVHLSSADFSAVERWASLIDRRGHWAYDATPPPGEERVQYLGALSWYGVAPPQPKAERVWVGPRMLVRQGDLEGFIADEIPSTGVGCPIAWRDRLREESAGANALMRAWVAERQEFLAIATLGNRIAEGLAKRRQRAAPPALARSSSRPYATDAAPASGSAVSFAPVRDSAAVPARRSITHPFRSMGTMGVIVVVTADSAGSSSSVQAAESAFSRVDSLMSNWTTTSEVARLNREAGSATVAVEPEVARVVETALKAWQESDGAFDITVEPLVRAWGFLGGRPRVPSPQEAEAAFRRVGARKLVFDSGAHTLHFAQPGVQIDLGGIAKGYAVDVAADSLRARGVTDALVDISGNMRALGSPANADHWRIGIRDPRDRMPLLRATARPAGEGDLDLGQVRTVRRGRRQDLRPHHGSTHRSAGRRADLGDGPGRPPR